MRKGGKLVAISLLAMLALSGVAHAGAEEDVYEIITALPKPNAVPNPPPPPVSVGACLAVVDAWGAGVSSDFNAGGAKVNEAFGRHADRLEDYISGVATQEDLQSYGNQFLRTWTALTISGQNYTFQNVTKLTDLWANKTVNYTIQNTTAGFLVVSSGLNDAMDPTGTYRTANYTRDTLLGEDFRTALEYYNHTSGNPVGRWSDALPMGVRLAGNVTNHTQAIPVGGGSLNKFSQGTALILQGSQPAANSAGRSTGAADGVAALYTGPSAQLLAESSFLVGKAGGASQSYAGFLGESGQTDATTLYQHYVALGDHAVSSGRGMPGQLPTCPRFNS